MLSLPSKPPLVATIATVATLLSLLVAPRLWAQENRVFAYGSPASAEQIAAWDIDVRPDGLGLPVGEGSVASGELLYEAQCASCHGSFGESAGGYPALAGGAGSLVDARPQRTVGSYWRYTSTLWDYIHRAMPFSHPESLSDNEVYAVTAYVLYLNDLVDDGFVLTQANLPDVQLPNEGNFVADPRPDTHNTRCMKACKDPGSIVVVSQTAVLGRDETSADVGDSSKSKERLLLAVADGREIAADRNRGNCFSCHRAEGAEMAGNIGPPLVKMQLRFPDRQALKTQIADPRLKNPATVMPPYGAHGILTNMELEHVVDYVHSL